MIAFISEGEDSDWNFSVSRLCALASQAAQSAGIYIGPACLSFTWPCVPKEQTRIAKANCLVCHASSASLPLVFQAFSQSRLCWLIVSGGLLDPESFRRHGIPQERLAIISHINLEDSTFLTWLRGWQASGFEPDKFAASTGGIKPNSVYLREVTNESKSEDGSESKGSVALVDHATASQVLDYTRMLGHEGILNSLAVFSALAELSERNSAHFEMLSKAVLQRLPEMVTAVSGLKDLCDEVDYPRKEDVKEWVHDALNQLAVIGALAELSQRNPAHYPKLARAILLRGDTLAELHSKWKGHALGVLRSVDAASSIGSPAQH